VDIGTTDVPGATAFYGSLFGWTVQDMGPDSGGYGIILRGGKQVAGIGPATDPDRGTSWAVYFATDSADANAAKVEANGGKVIMPPMDVFDQGRLAVFQDPTGVYFSVWQPNQLKGAEAVDEHGTMSWVELTTQDIATSKSFYEAVLPISTRDADIGDGQTYTLLQVGDKNVAGAMGVPAEAGGMPPQWTVYFAVDDCDAIADKAVELGATEMLRQDSPAGRFAFLTDPQGGVFGIIHNNPDFSM
jgi:hypothetical protein